MAISFYDLSVGTYLRILDAVDGVLDKGRAHCQENGIDLDSVVQTRLIDDMLPFRFQLISVTHHSLGALKGMEAGLFQPPPQVEAETYDELQAMVADARKGVAAYSQEAIEALASKEMVFQIGSARMPFTTEGFLLSFSLPNFYFHAATAYDILRMKGTPIGKRDFMGRMLLNT